MATTSLNPGVGPTNADIATAVAAPSAATIAAAVAAPSSATIASAVAAAVPTTAGITSIVQANAGSPYGGTLTNLGVINANNVGTTTITGLGSYKYLRFYCTGNSDSASWAWVIRFNEDANSNYFSAGAAGVSSAGGHGLYSTTSLRFSNQSTANNLNSAMIEIIGSNSAATKMTTATSITNISGYGFTPGDNIGVWNSTSAITSATIFTSNGGSWVNGCRIFVTGAN